MKYKGNISLGIVGGDREFEFEIDDEDLKDMEESDINEIAFESAMKFVEWTFWEDVPNQQQIKRG